MRAAVGPAAVVTLLVAGGLTAADAGAATTATTCTATWRGPVGGAWERAASWSTGQVPGPAEFVCLGASASVRVGATTAVDRIDVGSSRLAVATGVSVTVASRLDVAGGTLAGPGTLRVGGQGALNCCSSAVVLGSTRFVRGVHLEAVESVSTVGGPLAFSGGAVFVNSGYLTLGDGADLVDDDGDVSNAFVQSPTRFSELTCSSDARIGVTTTLGGRVSGSGDLELPRLTNETSDGILRGFEIRSSGTLTVPYPVTGLLDADVAGPSQVIATSTGEPAITATLRTLNSSSLSTGTATFAHGLVLTRSGLTTAETVSAPALILADASTMTLQVGGSVRIRRGTGTVEVRRDAAAGPVRLFLTYASSIEGSLAQHGGDLEVSNAGNGARITGDWTLDDGALASLPLDRWRGSVQAPKLTVQGSTTLAGSLVVVLQSVQHPPPVGTVTRLVSVPPGRLTGAFSGVSLPAGYALSYDARGVLVTRVA